MSITMVPLSHRSTRGGGGWGEDARISCSTAASRTKLSSRAIMVLIKWVCHATWSLREERCCGDNPPPNTIVAVSGTLTTWNPSSSSLSVILSRADVLPAQGPPVNANRNTLLDDDEEEEDEEVEEPKDSSILPTSLLYFRAEQHKIEGKKIFEKNTKRSMQAKRLPTIVLVLGGPGSVLQKTFICIHVCLFVCSSCCLQLW